MSTAKRIKQASIVNEGEKIILPARMGFDEAIQQITRMRDHDEQTIVIKEEVNAYYLDGAVAFNEAMRRIYGWTEAVAIPGFFGPTPPQMLQVEVGFGESRLIPTGRFELPGVTGFVQIGQAMKHGRIIMSFAASVKRKNEAAIHKLVELTREIVAAESIYRGKAFRIRFKDENGMQTDAQPQFLDLSSVKADELIFSESVDAAVRTSVFTPIEFTEAVRGAKIPLKRGVLLTGKYGVGKTLVAYVTADKAVKNGWTFIYCERADELQEAIRFAQQYGPAVIFCEDIDRVTAGERSVSMDDILNTLDGVDSKKSELMVILTTNHIDTINKAMLRPGRLDAIINVLPPDAEAVKRLIKLYARGLLAAETNLDMVAARLDGQIPAVIRECVERAKLSAIRLTHGLIGFQLDEAALNDASLGMQNQLALLNADVVKVSDAEVLFTLIGKAASGAASVGGSDRGMPPNVVLGLVAERLDEIKSDVSDIHEATC